MAFIGLLSAQLSFAQNGVRIAAATGTADPSAMLDVVSSTKGFLAPRLSLVGPALTNPLPVTSPVDGLLVYNLGLSGVAAKGFYYWNAATSAWVQLSAGALSGSGTVDYVAKWSTTSALSATTDGGIFGTSGGTGTTRTLTILENGDARVNFGSYPGAYTSALQIQNNDNSRFVWISPLDAASAANARLRVSGTGLDIYTGGANDAGTYSSTFASNGNVGIGSLTPTYTLDVAGASGTAGFNAIHKIGPLSNNTERGMWNPIYSAVGAGRPLYNDEEFATGANSVNVYNNSGGTGVQHFWENGDGSQPNSTGKWVRITNNGNVTSPGYGGFYQTINARRNATFVQRFRAKLPAGYTLNIAENAQGTNNTSYWLTPVAGTGKWEEYIRVSHCGNTGTFSSGGHVYVTGGATTFTWYLASCNIYEVDAPISNSGINTTFTQWGRNDCPATSSLVYAGYAAGAHYTHGGSGSNTVCLTKTPDWTGATVNDANHDLGLIYGVEWEVNTNNVTQLTSAHDYDAECAVCIVSGASVTLMIPGATVCPSSQGWTRQYWGYLMSNHYTQVKSEFICCANNPMLTGSNANSNGSLWYSVEAEIGSLRAPYIQNREVTCVVCTK